MSEEFLAGVDAAGTALNFGTDLVGNIMNYNVAKKNLAFQKDAFNYQKELNNLTMQREDNAVQRRMADLIEAGLSPYLAVGSSANSSSLSTGSAPQLPFQASFKDDYQFMSKNQRKLLTAQVEEAEARASMEKAKANYGNKNPAIYFQDNWINKLQYGLELLGKAGVDFKNLPKEIVDYIKEDKTDLINRETVLRQPAENRDLWYELNEIVDVGRLKSKVVRNLNFIFDYYNKDMLKKDINVDEMLGLAERSAKNAKWYTNYKYEINTQISREKLWR